MSKIFVDLYLDQYGQINVYRLDNGQVCMLKGDSLRRAESTIDMYNYSNTRYGVYGEIQVDEQDLVPVDSAYAFQQPLDCC
ncbi:MAG TPA: hypothetical protein VH500_05845 [Nitrososphaeraceae archaeon]